VNKNKSIFKSILKSVLLIMGITTAAILLIVGISFFVSRNSIMSASGTLGVTAASDAKQALTNQTEDLLFRLVQNQADLIDEKLSDTITAVSNMASMATIAYANFGYSTYTLDFLQNFILSNMMEIYHTDLTCYIATEQGSFIIPENYSGARPAPGFDPRARSWYISAKEAGKLIWTEVYEDNEGRGLAITCAKPFYDSDGVIAGVAGIGTFISDLNRIIAEAQIGQTGQAFIFNERNEIISSVIAEHEVVIIFLPGNPLDSVGGVYQELAAFMKSGNSGIAKVLHNDAEKFLAYSRLNTIPWIFAAVIDIDEVILPAISIEDNLISLTQSTFKSIDGAMRVILLSAIIITIIIILSIILVSYKLAKGFTLPIKQLTDDAKLIGSGDLDHFNNLKTGDELEILSDSINMMITNIKTITEEKERAVETAYKAIEEKNALSNLENIMNSLDIMIYVTEPKTGEILFINDSMKEHYGIKDDCVGKLCYKIFQKNFNERCEFCPCIKLDKTPDEKIQWEEYSTITNRIYSNTDRYINWPNGQIVHMQHSVDMTELIAAKDFAEQASHYKSAFLANMSHEIRTPMNAILGIAEIQLQTGNLAPDTNYAFGKIYESGDLLLNIINDILDLSKIEAGKMELTLSKYDIPSLIHDTAQLIRFRYNSNPLEFFIHVDENTPLEFLGDELRIKQILNNLLSNAFKYTDNGEIEFNVSFEPVDDDKQDENVILIFKVRDTGQGMNQEQLDVLFDEYTRFNNEVNRATTGTGLGMSITKQLVNLMNGEIKAESEPDKGTIFTVRIPQKRVNQSVCGPEFTEKLRDINFIVSSITKKTQFFREYMPYGSVLIVDDTESNIYVTKGMLLPYGLKIDTASSGFEAIDKIKNGNIYDIIFMDHMMPKMDGIEAVKIIRDMDYKNNIVALTANAIVGRAEMFLQNGFDGFISKPIDSRELNFYLNELIRNKKPAEVIEKARKEQREKNIIVTENESGIYKEKIMFFKKDAENAIFVLEDLVKKLPDINANETELYKITVHGIKSALANIGEKSLSNTAYILEKSAEDRNFSILTKNTFPFINSLKTLFERLSPALKTDDKVMSNNDSIFLREKLQEIKTACEDYDKKTAKTALNELKQKTWTAKITNLLDDISIYILHSSFKKIITTITNFLELNTINN